MMLSGTCLCAQVYINFVHKLAQQAQVSLPSSADRDSQAIHIYVLITYYLRSCEIVTGYLCIRIRNWQLLDNVCG